MLKCKILMVAALLAGFFALAQDTRPAMPPAQGKNHMPANSPEKRLKRMSKRLNLTAEQQEKLRPILADEAKQSSAVDSDTTLTPQQKHQKMHAIHLASRSQIDPILTAEQKAQMPATHAGGAGGHHHRPNGSAPAESTTPQ